MKELNPGQKVLAKMDYLEKKAGIKEKREKGEQPPYSKQEIYNEHIAEWQKMHGELDELKTAYDLETFADICDMKVYGKYGEAFNMLEEYGQESRKNKFPNRR